MNKPIVKLPSRRTTTIAVAAVAGLALVGGGTAVAVVGPAKATAAVRDSLDLEDSDQLLTGTVQAPAENDSLTDAQEDAALQALATVTPQQATDAATGAVAGSSAVSTQIDEEDGFVVYEVLVASPDGTLTEVVVDAGNASVLAREVEDDDDERPVVQPGSVPAAPQSEPAQSDPAQSEPGQPEPAQPGAQPADPGQPGSQQPGAPVATP